MRELNPEQQIATQHRNGPLLVLAGAGSGKTRIVTYRIVSMIESGVDASQIVAVTFTNKAAEEMRRRVQALLQRGPMPLISTFHSLGAKILREAASELGYKPNFSIYDEENTLKVLKKCALDCGLSEKVEIKPLGHAISSAKQLCYSPQECLENNFETMPPLLCQVYEKYSQEMKAANAIDFDDLLYLTVKLFSTRKDILADYQKRWHYLLIDEYQDTNHAQYLIAKFLIEKTHNLFVVGDPDQSIYSWRGANIQNILNFEKDYPGAKIVRLEQNYRSSEPILNGANALIAHNTSRYPKKLWSTKKGEKISLFVAPHERDEADFVASEIRALKKTLNIPYSEMAVLYRTNFQSRTFEDSFLHDKIPYRLLGGLSFYQRREIKDLLAFLQMVLNDNDFLAFSRTVNLPKRGLGQVTLEKIRLEAKSQNLTLWDFLHRLIDKDPPLKFSEKQSTALKDYIKIIEALRSFLDLVPVQKLVTETVHLSRYLDHLRSDPETFEERKANIDALIGKTAELEASANLASFLQELALKGEQDALIEESQWVSLMTLHHGKGLEFKVIFLVGMEEDLLPHANSRLSAESIEEERRLCYVGMTRAKERLYLTASKSRFLWGSYRQARPSRFLREIPKEVLTRIDETFCLA